MRHAKVWWFLGVIIVYYLNPLYIRSTAFRTASALKSFVDLREEEDPTSLKSAIANVTGDIDQLSSFLQDFFQRQTDRNIEEEFRVYLNGKARRRRHKELEWFLDWLLGFYKFMWPFLLVYIVMRITSGREGAKDKKQQKPNLKQKKLEDYQPKKRLQANSAGLDPKAASKENKLVPHPSRYSETAGLNRSTSATSFS